jgi:DNA-binding transcriptional LysR family regulator
VDLRQYRHVLALADHASFRKASEALGLTQPALTKSLFQIEREVGQRLFDRHGQTISPTVFGAIVVDTARKMLDSQEAMTRAIGQAAALDAGELSVAVRPYTADTWMGKVSGRLLQRYPRLRISIRVDPWESLPDLLHGGRVDLFVASIEQIRGRKGFRVVELPEQRGIWICRAGHPLTGQASPSRSALCQYVMISPQLTPRIQRWLEAVETPSRGFRRRVNTTSVTMIKAMVRESDAVTLIHPDEVQVELARGDFVSLNIGAPPLTFQTGLVWLADRSLSPAGIAFAREMFAEVGVDAESSLRSSAVGGKAES